LLAEPASAGLKENMNILYLAHRLPYPPDKGDRLRAFAQISHLAKHHRVVCACFVDDEADLQHIEGLRQVCAEVTAIPLRKAASLARGAWSLLSGGTLTEAYYRDSRMTRAVEDIMARINLDTVVAFSSSMAPYALMIPAVRRVLDLCDLDSAKWLTYAEHSGPLIGSLYLAEGRRLRRRELEWLRRFDATTLVTPAEAEVVAGHAPPGRLHVVGNGVTLPPPGIIARTAAGEGQPAADPIVGFVGQMDYRPNVDAVEWFVEEAWPTIRSAVPRARFRIVGRSPARAVQRLVAYAGVEVTGAVQDVTAEVARFDVSVAPLRIARGIQNKVLEAMACARPVVLTPEAAAGIRAMDDVHYVIAEDAPALAEATIALLGDVDARERIGAAARRFVTEHHRWDRELARFEQIVTGVLDAKDAAGADILRRATAENDEQAEEVGRALVGESR
jgi:sugar transferase (PEP-CTERM/EpsH1 system associated)